MNNKERYREDLEFTYGPAFNSIKWMGPQEAYIADMMRKDLLRAIGDRADFHYKGNKLIYRGLSEGCRHCAAGTWSCLFINNRCNAHCFFCPSQQDVNEIPSTVMLYFNRPEPYADYCRKIGIKGASISGGEPFLTPKRSLAFLRTCKKTLGDDFYFWLYTNGSLAKPELMKQMADAGLNEIRFDLAAWRYNLKMIEKAIGIVPVVTVETPAIPEDLPLMKEALVHLAEMGVNFVNLHQMRMTTYNCPKLMERNYSMVEGPHPAVVESELAALELMLFAAENELPIGINYCSFIYRNRFQTAAVQTQAGRFVIKPWEDMTETGLIRTISIEGDGDCRERIVRKLKDSGQEGWHADDSGQIMMKLDLFRSLNETVPLKITYSQGRLADIGGPGSETEGAVMIELDRFKTIEAVRKETLSVSLKADEISRFLEIIDSKGTESTSASQQKKVKVIKQINPLNPVETPAAKEEVPWDKIRWNEFIESGMQPY